MGSCCSVQSTTEKRVATRLCFNAKVCRHRLSLRQLHHKAVSKNMHAFVTRMPCIALISTTLKTLYICHACQTPCVSEIHELMSLTLEGTNLEVTVTTCLSEP